MNRSHKILNIFEYLSAFFDVSEIDVNTGEIIEEKFGSKIIVDFPSRRNNNRWKLTSKGYVGFIALGQELSIRLSPKINIGNLFLMLEYAYEFRGIDFQEDLIKCDSVEDFYDRLAILLANNFLEIVRKGLHKSYVPETGKFACIKGRVNTKSIIRNPWSVEVECTYQKFTGNIDDNKIIAWTLFLIANSSACSRALPIVRKSLQAVGSLVELKPCLPEDCINRSYHQLNQNYRPLHALCRFFLECSGASLATGNYSMLSFLVDMSRLFENFIASWLKVHLPNRYRLEKQERYAFTEDGEFKFFIDLVLYDLETGLVKSVIDTKYKPKIENGDITQIYFYAASKNCNDACLVYPSEPRRYRNKFPNIQGVTIRTLVFQLEGDLGKSGQTFMEELLQG